MIKVLQSLGGLYLRIESFTNSTHYITKSLQLARKVASEHPSNPAKLVDVADSLFALAQISHKQGQWQTALVHYYETLQVERTLGNEHIGIIFVLCSLGQVYQELGNLDRAFEYQERVLHLSREHVRDQRAFLAGILIMIGNIQIERGNAEDAMARFTESERIMTQVCRAQNAANFPISLMPLPGIGENLQAVVNLTISHEMKIFTAAAAA
mmetsp:Transcript_26362/g.38204  ORF Transcript_26362/g.38204 Transcript_26362/m.38204 type:complete len:211 (+) Transcript_26362:246-878(+)